jgi:HlyD family secretion protein
MNATTVQRVVTYDTIIEFANPELKLFPGMTAYVTIPVDTVQNALKLPNTALRYKPPMTPEEVLDVYKQYGISAADSKALADDASAGATGTPAASAIQNLPRTPKAESAVIWKLHPDNIMEPVKVSIGITDHAYTEVTALLKGQLTAGDDVIIRSITSKSAAPGALRH